jgi:hypothetical protein
MQPQRPRLPGTRPANPRVTGTLASFTPARFDPQRRMRDTEEFVRFAPVEFVARISDRTSRQARYATSFTMPVTRLVGGSRTARRPHDNGLQSGTITY